MRGRVGEGERGREGGERGREEGGEGKRAEERKMNHRKVNRR